MTAVNSTGAVTTAQAPFCESPEVLELQARIRSYVLDGSDQSRHHLKWLRSKLRKQRLMDARARGSHTESEWVEVLVRFGYRCVMCGCIPDPRPTKDHIVPLFLGGSDGIDNLQPTCRECNSSKGTSTFNWLKFREAYGFEEVVA